MTGRVNDEAGSPLDDPGTTIRVNVRRESALKFLETGEFKPRIRSDGPVGCESFTFEMRGVTSAAATFVAWTDVHGCDLASNERRKDHLVTSLVST